MTVEIVVSDKKWSVMKMQDGWSRLLYMGSWTHDPALQVTGVTLDIRKNLTSREVVGYT